MTSQDVPPEGSAASGQPEQPVDETAQQDPAYPPTQSEPQQYPWPAPDQATQVLNPDAAASAAPTGTTPTAATTAWPQYDQGQQQPTTAWPAPDADGYIPPPPGAAPAPETPARPSGAGKYIAIAAITGLLAGIGGGALGYQMASGNSGSSSSVTVNNPANPGDLSNRANGSVASIAADVLPSVVSIEVSGGNQSGTGSGFFIRPDGYILTNNHVTEVASQGGSIEVVLQDGTKVPAELVGANADYDLAVIKIDKGSVPALTLGNSDSLKVGDEVIAVGSPLGLEGTVTTGIVSALDRPVTTGGDNGSEASFIAAVQTDAAINPGNSGGPLVNSEGQAVGVNSAIASVGSSSSGEAGNIGLSFAIPINTANRIAQELIQNGDAATPIIGAKIDFSYNGDGARVQEVTVDGPAAKAGLQNGDVIVEVNGQRVDDAVALISDIRKNQPGDEITLTLENGKQIKVTLGQM